MTIQYSGPAIDPEMPWEIRRHIQLLYQKLGNHTQAFQEVSNRIAGIKGGTTTTIIEGGGGSTPVPPPSTGFLGQGLINDQSGQTSYATGPGDNGILLILNDASPVSVTLTTAAAPYYLIITNFGAGIVTLSPSTGAINGGASLSLLQNQTVIASCDSTNWKTTASSTPPETFSAITHEFLTAYDAATGEFTAAQPDYSDLTGTPTLPSDAPATASKWINSFTAATGVFTESQPGFSDISGQIATSQLPTAGITATITTAALTSGGTQGSMTFTNGILTAQVQAT